MFEVAKEGLDKLRLLMESADETNNQIALQIAQNDPNILLHCKEHLLIMLIYSDDKELMQSISSLDFTYFPMELVDIVQDICKRNYKWEFRELRGLIEIAKPHLFDRQILINVVFRRTADERFLYYLLNKGLEVDYDNMLNVQSLSLNDAQYVKWKHQDLSVFRNIRTIELFRGSFRSIPTGIKKLSKLKILRCQYNQIEELDEDFFAELLHLGEFIADDNLITELPESIGFAKNLKTISIANNQLEALPLSICALGNLQKLNLEENYIEYLPGKIGDLQNLRTLYLFDNKIRKLPESFRSLSNLEKLTIALNSFEIPQYIYEFPLLKIDQLYKGSQDEMLELLRFHSFQCYKYHEEEPDIVVITDDYDSEETYFERLEDKLSEKDCINAVLLDELHWEDYLDDWDGEDKIDQLFYEIPTLKRYQRIWLDDGLTLRFLESVLDDYLDA